MSMTLSPFRSSMSKYFRTFLNPAAICTRSKGTTTTRSKQHDICSFHKSRGSGGIIWGSSAGLGQEQSTEGQDSQDAKQTQPLTVLVHDWGECCWHLLAGQTHRDAQALHQPTAAHPHVLSCSGICMCNKQRHICKCLLMSAVLDTITDVS